MALFDRVAEQLVRWGLLKAAFPNPIPNRQHVTRQWSDESPPDAVAFQDYATAFSRVAMVYRVVGIVAENVSSVVPKVYSRDGVEQTEHELTKLLTHVNPKDWTWKLLYSTMLNMSIGGETFWQLVRGSRTGRIMEIWNRRPDRIHIDKGDPMYREVKGYRYEASPTAPPVHFETDDILHFKYEHPEDDYRGLPPIQAAREGIIIDIYIHTDRKAFFRNSSRPAAVLETDQELADPTYERLHNEWNDMYKGPARAHKTTILDKGLKVKPMTVPPADAQWLEQQKISWQEIALIFGVPPVLVGMWEAANYATAVQAKKSFWEETVIPTLKLLSGAMNEFLCPRFNGNVHIDWDLSSVEALQEAESEKWMRYDQMLQRGAVTINEVREWLRLGDPVPWGNTYYVPLTMVPIGTVSEEEEPKAVILPEGMKGGWTVLTPPQIEPQGKRIDFGSEEHERLWKIFRARTAPREKAMMRRLKKEFDRQEGDVKGRLRQLEGYHPEPETEAVKDTSPEDLADRVLFSGEDEQKRFRKIFGPTIAEALEAAGISALSDLALDIDFSIEHPEVVTFLQKKTFTFAEEVNQTTIDKLRGELIEGFTEGESIRQLEDRVAEAFNIRRGFETERIARTEIVGASNQGSFQAYKQSGVVAKKSWLAAFVNTRPSHEIAHVEYMAQPIPLDQKFIVGTSSMDAPGDPSAKPEEIINCMCTILPIVEV